MTLLASAPSLDAIRESIARFYCGEEKNLEPLPGRIEQWIVTGSTGMPLLGVRVVKRGKRFRFEMIA